MTHRNDDKMIIFLSFLFAIIGYGIVASLPFTKLAKEFPILYFAIGVAMGALLNFTWLFLAKSIETNKIIVMGLIWDAVLTLTYILIPAIIWQQEITWKIWAGVFLIVCGMSIAKV